MFSDYEDSLKCSETAMGIHFVCIDASGWPGTYDDEAGANLKLPMPWQG